MVTMMMLSSFANRYAKIPKFNPFLPPRTYLAFTPTVVTPWHDMALVLPGLRSATVAVGASCLITRQNVARHIIVCSATLLSVSLPLVVEGIVSFFTFAITMNGKKRMQGKGMAVESPRGAVRNSKIKYVVVLFVFVVVIVASKFESGCYITF